MASKRQNREQGPRVLVINDLEMERRLIVANIADLCMHPIVAPANPEELLSILDQIGAGSANFELVVLDYYLSDWTLVPMGTDDLISCEAVFKKVRPVTEDTRPTVVFFTVDPRQALKFTRRHHNVYVIDSSDSSVRDRPAIEVLRHIIIETAKNY